MNLSANKQTDLYGLEDEFFEFVKLYDNKKLPNKILLSGQKGIGKCTLAYHLINFILSQNEEFSYNLSNLTINQENKSFKLIQNGSNPNFNLIDINTEKKKIESHTVIIATGAKAKWLNVEGEEKFRGYGVSACATCDGFFFKDKVVAVVGGGNTAAEEALFLSNLCKEVILIHRRRELRAEKILQKRLFEKKNIKIFWDTSVKEILGDIKEKKISSILVKDLLQKEEREISIDGFFVAIGHNPSTQIFEEKVSMDNDGYILTSADSTKTNVDGVFAAGDVTDRIFRQAVTAASMGCMSALEAEVFLTKKKII